MSQAEIKTKLTADGSELSRAFDQGMTKAANFRSQVQNIGKAIGAAFTVQGIINFAANLAEMSDKIQDASGALGLSTDEMQAFDAVARRTAGGVEGFRTAIGRLIQAQADAIRGDERAVDLMVKIGAGNTYASATTADLVKSLADYYKQTNDLATLQDIFGRGVVNIREGLESIASQSIPALIDAQKNLGQVIDSEGIKKLALLKDKWEEAKIAAASYVVDAGASFGTKNIKGPAGITTELPQAFRDFFAGLGARAGALSGGASSLEEVSRIMAETVFGTGPGGGLKPGVGFAPGVGSISDRTAAQASEKMVSRMREEINADKERAKLIGEREESAADMLNFLNAERQAQEELNRLAREAVELANEKAAAIEAASVEQFGQQSAARNLLMGFMPGQDQRFSNLRRMGANELGSGVAARDNPAAIADKIIDKVTSKIAEGTAAFKDYGQKVLQGIGSFI